MLKYNLRPHHGLCLNFFKGEGYSEEFVLNMTNIVNSLNENPMIELVDHSDNLCKSCHHRTENGGCETNEKVIRYDSKVLEYCDLSTGDILSWQNFLQKVNDNILSKDKLKYICNDCEWYYICSEML